MALFAIIKTGGKQYRVKEGDTLVVEKLDGEKGKEIALSDVLMVSDEAGDSVKIGTPVVSGATVTALVKDQGLGKKTTAFKYKRKVRYRKHLGHRQEQTTLTISKITA